MYNNPNHGAHFDTAGIENAGAARAYPHPSDVSAKRAAMASQALVGGNAPTREPTATEFVTSEVEVILDTLRQLVERQNNQRDRLFGPRPENPSKDGGVGSAGHFGVIVERLGWLRALSVRALENQYDLERVG